MTDEVAESLFLPREWLQSGDRRPASRKASADLLRATGNGQDIRRPSARRGTSRATAASSELVQFHPSLQLRGLLRGLPARSRTRTHGRPLRAAPTGRCARSRAGRARATRHSPYVLIIDEINRGNIAEDLRRAAASCSSTATKRAAPVLAATSVRAAAEPLRDRDDEHGRPVDRARRRRAAAALLLRRAHRRDRGPVAASSRKWLERHGLDDEPARPARRAQRADRRRRDRDRARRTS